MTAAGEAAKTLRDHARYLNYLAEHLEREDVRSATGELWLLDMPKLHGAIGYVENQTNGGINP
ncbi:hypothetical protein M3223_04265 [Paenibacillus pasadenensis]|uniref:hypothetical protein n=1 Tax=Paenibacillus pasadenensis TaxID=217090 RepID=UPI00203F5DC8|nr:hypothetical protein [Paenibacillus pasadenensis]MCM3746564.1 hypothetical protein [Paenibacillus pasadenensis]